MSIKHQVKNFIDNCQERYWINRHRKSEINKFQDPRRKAIYEEVHLSKEQEMEIDDLYLHNYGKKIPYTWHKHFTAFTGHFDPAYFPELLYIPELEYYMNYDKHMQSVINDKNILPMIAAGIGVSMPQTVFSCVNGVLRNSQYQITDIESIKEKLHNSCLFGKPSIDTGSGKGCIIVDSESNEFYSDIKTLGNNYIVQERITCSNSISALHPNSVNTFRIMTYKWNNKIEIVPVILRIGRGESYLDNAHAGGIFIGINPDGSLHEKAFTEFKEVYTEHPDSHIQFAGYKIQNYERVIEAATLMHSAIPHLGIINWDFTIDIDEKPVLIEANTFGAGIWVFQMAWGCGPFGENTAEMLRWLRAQKENNSSKRT